MGSSSARKLPQVTDTGTTSERYPRHAFPPHHTGPSSRVSATGQNISVTDLPDRMHSPLKLRAEDSEDIDIMSSLLQDAIIPGSHFHYDKAEQTFFIKANRFCWETPPHTVNGTPVFTRVQTAIEFKNILRVQTQNFDQKAHIIYYDLLSVTAHRPLEAFDEQIHDMMCIDLICAGGARIRLHTSQIEILVIDSQETTFTETLPRHDDSAIEDFEISERVLREFTTSR